MKETIRDTTIFWIIMALYVALLVAFSIPSSNKNQCGFDRDGELLVFNLTCL